MRIVQTFWTAGRDPLTHGFGWTHPEYNLMSWALSCLSLREHYDEVALYTDAQGKRVLIDLLHLPYTEVHVVYDETLCLPQHWAYAKIKTYSLQTKPFLHVDGDVYLPKPIPEDILNAPLIAQNREIGTMYYKRMMDKVLNEPGIKLPAYIEEALRQESITSYNMGVFGGTDLAFIHEYCEEVMHFIDDNKMNDKSCSHSGLNCNVFFEQVIFAVFADKRQRDVAGVFGRSVRDEGYTRKEFCNFLHYADQSILHLLGGHKRNKYVRYGLESFMLTHHTDAIRTIIEIIPQRDLSNALMTNETPIYESLYHLIPELRSAIGNQLSSFRDTPETYKASLMQRIIQEDIDRASCAIQGTLYTSDASGISEVAMEKEIHCSSGLLMFALPNNIDPQVMGRLKEVLGCSEIFPLTHLAIYPTLRPGRLEVVPIEANGADILMFLQKQYAHQDQSTKVAIRDIVDWMVEKLHGELHVCHEAYRVLAIQNIKYLTNKGCLVIP